MEDTEKVEKKTKETFVIYCQRIKETLTQDNRRNSEKSNDNKIEVNEDGIANHVRSTVDQ